MLKGLDNWERDPRIWCPMVLGVMLSMVGVSRYAISEARNLKQQR
jgi:hypothetical protein